LTLKLVLSSYLFPSDPPLRLDEALACLFDALAFLAETLTFGDDALPFVIVPLSFLHEHPDRQHYQQRHRNRQHGSQRPRAARGCGRASRQSAAGESLPEDGLILGGVATSPTFRGTITCTMTAQSAEGLHAGAALQTRPVYRRRGDGRRPPHRKTWSTQLLQDVQHQRAVVRRLLWAFL